MKIPLGLFVLLILVFCTDEDKKRNEKKPLQSKYYLFSNQEVLYNDIELKEEKSYIQKGEICLGINISHSITNEKIFSKMEVNCNGLEGLIPDYGDSIIDSFDYNFLKNNLEKLLQLKDFENIIIPSKYSHGFEYRRSVMGLTSSCEKENFGVFVRVEDEVFEAILFSLESFENNVAVLKNDETEMILKRIGDNIQMNVTKDEGGQFSKFKQATWKPYKGKFYEKFKE